MRLVGFQKVYSLYICNVQELYCKLYLHAAKYQSRTQSNACARARMALALGKLNFSCAVIGLTCMPTKPEPLNLGVPVVNFPRANAILARAQALLWVRDWPSIRCTEEIVIN